MDERESYLVYFENDNPLTLEDELIASLNPPLNLKKNKNIDNWVFRKELSIMRNLTVEYDIAIITYFDILGFKNNVEQNHDPQKILEIMEKFRCSSTPDKEIAEMYEQKFINFSDCAVRITNILSEVNKTASAGLLFYELLDVLHLQFELVNLCIFY